MMKTLDDEEDDDDIINVLSLDGGGIRGLVIAQVKIELIECFLI